MPVRPSHIGGVIPVLGTGIQSSAGAAASCEMDPGHKARDDNAEITQ